MGEKVANSVNKLQFHNFYWKGNRGCWATTEDQLAPFVRGNWPMEGAKCWVWDSFKYRTDPIQLVYIHNVFKSVRFLLFISLKLYICEYLTVWLVEEEKEGI